MFAKFNLKINYPSPYLREVWHYKEANADLIKQAINNFLDKNYNIFQTTRVNHIMIFFKIID